MKYLLSILLFLLIYYIECSAQIDTASIYPCPQYQQHFQKILGYRPAISIIQHATILFSSTDQRTPIGVDRTLAINAECWHQCLTDIDCNGYALFFNASTCFGFTKNQRSTKYTIIDHGGDRPQLVPDRNVAYFEKICLKKSVPFDCRNKLWLFTKIPGNSLIFQGRKTLSNLVSKTNCSEQCLSETEFKCLSATFISSYRNNYMRSLSIEPHQRNDAYGTCILSDKDKSNQPDAFRVSSDNEEYIENQCVDRGSEQDSCSYEVYSNSRLIYADVEYRQLTERQCKDRCASEKRFFCQGISFSADKRNYPNTICLLHSEDIVSLGPRSLIAATNFVYMKRVKCLNVTVACSRDEMVVTYTPNESFLGRIYVSSHSEECSSQGKGLVSTLLRLSIGSTDKEERCGIVRAYQINDGSNRNRTLVSTLLVIQSNPIVQTQSDRLVKIGCILDANSNSSMDDVAIGSSLTFTQRDPLNQGSLVYNISEEYPKVSMQVIDLNENQQITDVELGQDLELQIILDPPNSIYDIRAIQLIAKSDTGHNSILLIDNRGCPTDLTVFPALEKRSTNWSNLLFARFHAFKFAGSAFVKFEVKIQFCLHECSPINCGRNVWSNGRRKKRNEPMSTMATIIGTVEPSLNHPNKPNELLKSGIEKDNSFRNIAEKQLKVLQPNSIISQRVLSKVTLNSVESNETAQVIETSRRNFTNNNRILQQIDDVPLQVKLNVRTPELSTAAAIKNGSRNNQSLIYGENNNQIFVAALDADSNDMICINEVLIVILLFLWLIIQLVLIATCLILIRRYKRLAAYDDDQSSLEKIHRALEIDNLSRRVRWADDHQGRSQVLMYT